jgi:predicted transcriptional regulator of viral defense system
MIYTLITEKYEKGEPIFFSDIYSGEISKSALTQQLATLCKKGLLAKYDNGIYYLPKKTRLKTSVGPTADTIARYKYIFKNGKTTGFYSGNTFANQLGISTQVPNVIEIVSNNTNSAPRNVRIGNRKFYVRKPPTSITDDNVYILQMLDLLSNLDNYSDYDYEDIRKYFLKFIDDRKITRKDVDQYIRSFPLKTFRFYYELRLDNVLT